jgi:hypothetical protein
MNDFIFLIASENMAPDNAQPRPWFVVVPNKWRQALVHQTTRWTKITANGGPLLTTEQAPFFVSRIGCAGLFLLVASGLAWRVVRNMEAPVILEACFLTLAWFWLLSPTLNPWYWSWALPLIPFARSRAWLAMSGLLFIYYVRFYLVGHFPDEAVIDWLAPNYNGAYFYDYVVVWWEFAPWFVWLFLAWCFRLPASRSQTDGADQSETVASKAPKKQLSRIAVTAAHSIS